MPFTEAAATDDGTTNHNQRKRIPSLTARRDRPARRIDKASPPISPRNVCSGVPSI